MRLLHRFPAAIGIAARVSSAALLCGTPTAHAASKPSSSVVKPCQEAMRQANHVLLHFNDFVNLSDAQGSLVQKLANTGDASTFADDWNKVQTGISNLAPQVADALAGYQTAEAKCVKALGIKQSSVTPPSSPSTSSP